ncbi:hypothetical protein J3458_000850 [Metarhizium acridum]|uniref:uncharacterized protein n=1 Tax=Metarhizium acridum TaxID=92637 RepID=UPI001C6B2C5A|nr:hypothetical protein J3458_000850 [Metarhizium acridum]
MYGSPTTSEGSTPVGGITVDKQVVPRRETSSSQMAQQYGSWDISNPGHSYEHHNIVKVLIPISVVGWMLFGAICILCINGRGRAGRWIPEWYLDSEGKRWDKAAVGAWWLAVLFGWPLILPGVVVGSLSRKLKMWRAEKRLKTQKTGKELDPDDKV